MPNSDLKPSNYATLYHGHPLPIFLARGQNSLTARLSLRQKGRTGVGALVEGAIMRGPR